MTYTALTDDQRSSFEEQGFLIVKNALTPAQVEKILEISDQLVASDIQHGRATHSSGRYDGFRNVVTMDQAYLDLLMHEATFPLVLQLLGPNLQLQTSHLIYSQPGPAELGDQYRSPGWHRDIHSTSMDLGHHAIPRLEIKVAFQLSDASKENCGQTLVSPGSHQWTERFIPTEEQPDPEFISPLLSPGDAMLFENRTWHAGGPNLTGKTRKCLMFGYGYRWMRPDDYLQQNPEFLDRCDPVQRSLFNAGWDHFHEDGTFQPNAYKPEVADWARERGVEQVGERCERLNLKIHRHLAGAHA